MNSKLWSKALWAVAALALTLPLAWAQTASKTVAPYDVKSEVKVKG